MAEKSRTECTYRVLQFSQGNKGSQNTHPAAHATSLVLKGEVVFSPLICHPGHGISFHLRQADNGEAKCILLLYITSSMLCSSHCFPAWVQVWSWVLSLPWVWAWVTAGLEPNGHPHALLHPNGIFGVKLDTEAKGAHCQPCFHVGFKHQDRRTVAPTQHFQLHANTVASVTVVMVTVKPV